MALILQVMGGTPIRDEGKRDVENLLRKLSLRCCSL